MKNFSRLEISCFCLFAAMQAKKFRAIYLPKQGALLIDENGASISKIGLASIINIIELCKHAD